MLTGQATGTMQTMAAAAEELSASIGEINRQVTDSSRMAQEGVAEVKRNDATFSTLSESAAQIGMSSSTFRTSRANEPAGS